MMSNPLTQAVLLLTAHFSKPAPGEAKPLTPTEWGRFAAWLNANRLSPDVLLTGDPAQVLTEWADAKVGVERICALLSRSPALALALEKWQRAGLWVITRQDPDYPSRLKQLLKSNSPPLFFGCGNRQLLNRGGVAVVGSRDAGPNDLQFARELGARAAEEGLSIVSGGARGVDEAAMLGALEREGTVVGVLADRLLKAATSGTWRGGVMAGNLVLISPFNPEAGFEVGNAMARNKYVYCLSDAAVVVHSGAKGGTWTGALENLKNGWVPLWVKSDAGPGSANALIVQQGARRLTASPRDLNLRSLFGSAAANASIQAEGYDLPPPTTAGAVGEGSEGYDAQDPSSAETPAGPQRSTGGVAVGEEQGMTSLYELFLRHVERVTEKEAKTIEQLAGELEIGKAQATAWVKRALEEKRLLKYNKPVRYAWPSSTPKPKQASIF